MKSGGDMALRIHPLPKWETIAAFIFGMVFVSLITWIAIRNPNPSDFSYTVFRIVIALAAAGVGAILPGFIDLRYKDVLRAGGAVALFLIVYFGVPAGVSSGGGDPKDLKMDAEPAVLSWLSKVDSNDKVSAYNALSRQTKDKFTFEQFNQLTAKYLTKVGSLQQRSLVSTNSFTNPPGSPRGVYRQFVYEAKYASEPKVVIWFVVATPEDGAWRVFGFNLGTKNETGVLVPFEPSN